MAPGAWRLAVLVISMALCSCSRYLPISWREVPGRADSVEASAKRLVSGLEAALRAREKEGRVLRPGSEAGGKSGPLRVVAGAFAEARTGFRTELSRRIERAVRRELQASPLFTVMDGGEAVRWQEASSGVFSSPRFPPRLCEPFDPFGPIQDEDLDCIPRMTVVGGIEEKIKRRRKSGESPEKIREALDLELDGDHPISGLWPAARRNPYGEGSAVFAAQIHEADVAVYGAYALGPGRIRIWAAAVGNGSERTVYYRRGLEDMFGEPVRLTRSRLYLGHARDAVPLGAVEGESLSSWIPPDPRKRPRHPPFWGESSFEAAFEQIGRKGTRTPLRPGARLDAETLVVGHLSAKNPRFVYGFSLGESGRVEKVLAAPGGGPIRMKAGERVLFHARLLPPGQSFRVYFVSSNKGFDPSIAVGAARTRLGLAPRGAHRSAEGWREAGDGWPEESWYVQGGQERLILPRDWDQEVFWFSRVPGR